MQQLSSEVAIVTGGGRGIGRAIVERLVHNHMQVSTCGRSQRPDDLPEQVLWTQLDVSDPDAANCYVEDTQKQLGPVSLLVNNAGVQLEKSVADSSDDDWDLVIGVNCRGTFNMCRAVLPLSLIHISEPTRPY